MLSLLVDNATATAIWKGFADQTGEPRIVAFAQRLVTLTDWSLTFWGVVLTIGGGYAAAVIGQFDLRTRGWSSARACSCSPVPCGWGCSCRYRRAWRGWLGDSTDEPIPRADIVAGRMWFVIVIASTVPLIGAAWVMITKP